MSQLNVDAIRSANGTGDAITLAAASNTCTANITNPPSDRRNLIINGDMNVAARCADGVYTSTDSGYHTVDRWKLLHANTDEAPTQEQGHVLSGTTPYELGFRKTFKVTNGNQTNGLSAPDYILMRQVIEAQNLATSGWNYTSSSSYITLSFWCRSSVAQNFYGSIRSEDGTRQNYPFETGSLTANTWTKITKKIPGNSNLQFDNNTGAGMEVEVNMAFGGNYTDSGVALNTWAAYASATINPDNTTTWYTTNDATFELTGVQLEVGDYATDYAHEPFSLNSLRCKRYYQTIGSYHWIVRQGTGVDYGHACLNSTFPLPVPMRTTPVGSNFDGTSTVTVKWWNAAYNSSTNLEAYIGEQFHNENIIWYLCHNEDDNSGTVLNTTKVMGELQDTIAFDAEL